MTEPGASACPGCGAVIVDVPVGGATRPGASPSCAGLFEVTVRGARDEAPSDVRSAAVVALADAAYTAQHTPDPAQRTTALLVLRERVGGGPGGVRPDEVPPVAVPRPATWTSTPADVAADLDVVDLGTLVQAWAEAVWQDWSAAHEQLDPAPAAHG